MRAARSTAFFDDISPTLEDMDVDEEEDRMSLEPSDHESVQVFPEIRFD